MLAKICSRRLKQTAFSDYFFARDLRVTCKYAHDKSIDALLIYLGRFLSPNQLEVTCGDVVKHAYGASVAF